MAMVDYGDDSMVAMVDYAGGVGVWGVEVTLPLVL